MADGSVQPNAPRDRAIAARSVASSAQGDCLTVTARAGPAAGNPAFADDTLDPRECRRLWVWVLSEQWRLAFGSAKVIDHQCRVQAARQAQAWFGSADFATVCHLAGVDPGSVMLRFRGTLRAFRAAGEPAGFLARAPYRRQPASPAVAA